MSKYDGYQISGGIPSLKSNHSYDSSNSKNVEKTTTERTYQQGEYTVEEKVTVTRKENGDVDRYLHKTFKK